MLLGENFCVCDVTPESILVSKLEYVVEPANLCGISCCVEALSC